jgi:hypothetical protein
MIVNIREGRLVRILGFVYPSNVICEILIYQNM